MFKIEHHNTYIELVSSSLDFTVIFEKPFRDRKGFIYIDENDVNHYFDDIDEFVQFHEVLGDAINQYFNWQIELQNQENDLRDFAGYVRGLLGTTDNISLIKHLLQFKMKNLMDKGVSRETLDKIIVKELTD